MHPAVRFFQSRFEAEGKPDRAEWEKAYMKSSLRFHGVANGAIKKAVAAYVKEHKQLTRAELKAAVDALYATDWFDLRHAGVYLIARRVKLLEAADADWLISLVRKSACWAHVDALAVNAIGALIEANPALLKKLPTWAKDDDFWVRRTALLAQHDALKEGGGDFELFERIAAPMLPEKEFFIRKAIGWVLREVSKKRPALTHRFLLAHKGKAAGLTVREGSKYLPPRMRDEVT